MLFGGCLGGPSDSDQGSTDETDGYPPKDAVDRPEERTVDTDSFERITVDGTDVPLAPIDVTYYWYRLRDARFADTRGESSYKKSHVLGAVLSPAPDGREADPVEQWSKEDRIVCYCGCPHHLSSLRAAELIRDGYENVYVIDEGFWEWHDRGYPMAGSEISTQPAVHRIRGRTDTQYAGETAWAWHERSGQREATEIGDRGEYLLELRFSDVSLDSPIRIETPEYDVRAPLRILVSGTVTG